MGGYVGPKAALEVLVALRSLIEGVARRNRAGSGALGPCLVAYAKQAVSDEQREDQHTQRALKRGIIEPAFDRTAYSKRIRVGWSRRICSPSELLRPVWMQPDRTKRGFFVRWRSQNLYLEAKIVRGGWRKGVTPLRGERDNQPRARATKRAFRLAGKKVGQPPRFQILTGNHACKGFFAGKLPS